MRTVQDCPSASVAELVGERQPAAGRMTQLRWSIAGDPGRGWVLALFVTDSRAVLVAGGGVAAMGVVDLVTTPVPHGGRRYLAVCGVRGCARRVSRLFLPPGARWIGCRHCYRLSYHSRQRYDKRVARLLRADAEWPADPPERLSDVQLGLLLAALAERRRRMRSRGPSRSAARCG